MATIKLSIELPKCACGSELSTKRYGQANWKEGGKPIFSPAYQCPVCKKVYYIRRVIISSTEAKPVEVV